MQHKPASTRAIFVGGPLGVVSGLFWQKKKKNNNNNNKQDRNSIINMYITVRKLVHPSLFTFTDSLASDKTTSDSSSSSMNNNNKKINWYQTNLQKVSWGWQTTANKGKSMCLWINFLIYDKQRALLFCSRFTFNPLTPKISLLILLSVGHTVLVMLVWRIWYWINL